MASQDERYQRGRQNRVVLFFLRATFMHSSGAISAARRWMLAQPSLRANGSRECAPDDRLREAIHSFFARRDGLLRRGVYHRAGQRPDPLAPRNDELNWLFDNQIETPSPRPRGGVCFTG